MSEYSIASKEKRNMSYDVINRVLWTSDMCLDVLRWDRRKKYRGIIIAHAQTSSKMKENGDVMIRNVQKKRKKDI